MPSAGRSRSSFAQVEDRETVRTSDSQPGAKAAELAVFLACHFGGADARTIGEYLEPDARLRQADQHVHNNVSNLRHVRGRAAGFRRTAYLPRDDGRYRLDPATATIDIDIDIDIGRRRHRCAWWYSRRRGARAERQTRSGRGTGVAAILTTLVAALVTRRTLRGPWTGPARPDPTASWAPRVTGRSPR